jgi:predicted protein tyrosine phosphatase
MAKGEAPKGYNECAERVARHIQAWIEKQSAERFVDLRFKDWGRIVYAGSVVPETVDFLAESPDARALLLHVGEREPEATLLMTCVVLETLGYKRKAAHLDRTVN